jgi:hypothetical protein
VGRGGRFDGTCNGCENALPVTHDIVIIEAQNAETFRGQVRISAGIALLVFCFEVLSAVNLNDKLCRMADEIHNIWSDGRLTRCFVDTRQRVVFGRSAITSALSPPP